MKPLLTAFSTAILLLSCTKPIAVRISADCKNGGTSIYDSCKCPSGYTGKLCEELTQSAIIYINNTLTNIYMTVDGKNSVLRPGDSIIFPGKYGNALNVAAETYETDANGNQLGERIIYTNLSRTFLPRDTIVISLNIPSSHFMLRVQNQHPSYNAYRYTLTYGSSPVQFTYYVTVPNNGHIYSLGYYLALPSCRIVFFASGSSHQWFLDPKLNFNTHQIINMNLR